MKDKTFELKNFKDPLGSKVKDNVKTVVKGVVTVAIALPLIGAIAGMLGGSK